MNNTGKTITALTALSLLMAIAWFGIDGRGQRPDPSEQRLMQPGAGSGSQASLSKEDEIWLSEISLSVGFISETLTASGNVGAAIALLDAIDRRLALQPSSSSVTLLRTALASDRQQLNAARAIDLATVAAVLDRAMQATESLRLVSSPGMDRRTSVKLSASASSGETSWQEIVAALQGRLTEAVRIRRIEHPDAVFLTAEQGVFVRERLRLRFLSAKLALLSRQEKVLMQDLLAAERILQQAFDPTDPNVVDQITAIGQLKKVAPQFSAIALRELPKAILTLQGSGPRP